jgi:hypothetical protein
MNNSAMNIKLEVEALFDHYLGQDALHQPIRDVLLRRSEVPETLQGKRMLFFGINPSDNGLNPSKEGPYRLSDAVDHYPKYFLPFESLATKAGCKGDWTYMDLFYHRRTDQRDIDVLLRDTAHGIPFLANQLVLTQKVLEWARPKIIVVCNARAADFFGVNTTPDSSNIWMGYKFEFDPSYGLHRIQGLHDGRINPDLKTTSLEGVPVCFTSTLKYMDRFSKERLAWQLKRALTEV